MRVHIRSELCLAQRPVRQGRSCAVDAHRTSTNVHRHMTNEQLAAHVARHRMRSIPRTGPDDSAHITMLDIDSGRQALVRRAEVTQEVG